MFETEVVSSMTEYVNSVMLGTAIANFQILLGEDEDKEEGVSSEGVGLLLNSLMNNDFMSFLARRTKQMHEELAALGDEEDDDDFNPDEITDSDEEDDGEDDDDDDDEGKKKHCFISLATIYNLKLYSV